MKAYEIALEIKQGGLPIKEMFVINAANLDAAIADAKSQLEPGTRVLSSSGRVADSTPVLWFPGVQS